jgi:hypothetical protein
MSGKRNQKVELTDEEIQMLVEERKRKIERQQETDRFNQSLERLLKRADKANLEIKKELFAHMITEPWKRYTFRSK